MHDAVRTGQREPKDEKSGGNARSPQTLVNLLRDAHALTLRPRRPMQKLRKTQHASAMRNRLLGSAALQVHSLKHHSAKEDQPRWSTNRKRRHTSHSLPRSNASWPSRQSREVHPWTTLRSGAGVPPAGGTPIPRGLKAHILEARALSLAPCSHSVQSVGGAEVLHCAR